jgi:hypothetical protein
VVGTGGVIFSFQLGDVSRTEKKPAMFTPPVPFLCRYQRRQNKKSPSNLKKLEGLHPVSWPLNSGGTISVKPQKYGTVSRQVF